MVHDARVHFTPMPQAALRIARKGKPVFPCKPDKAPYTPRGFKDASADPEQVDAWWDKWPEAKIGMPTGTPSRVFVFDVDPKHGGWEALETLESEHGTLPDTLTVRTPSGGLHYYFQHVDGLTNRTGQLPAGIDIRGEGGYVIAPPSAGYTVENRAPIADAPAWLLEALRDEPRKPSGPGRSGPRATFPDDGGPIHEGGRDEALTRIAGRLHDGTRDLAQLEDDLHIVNEARCIPPLPAGQVRKIARSIYRYDPCRPPRRDPDPETARALAQAERAILAREWKGKGGKTRYSIAVAALTLARKYGQRVEGGVRVEASARQLALAAAVSLMSIIRNVKQMGDVLRPDNENVEDGKSGAFILLAPPAPTDTTLPTGVGFEGGCISSRAPFSAPRLRWSSPACKPRRGVVPGTSKVRTGPTPEKRAAVIRLGKGCEMTVDAVEAAGGSMTLADLAGALHLKQTRDLTRRRNPKRDKGRDGYVTRLLDVGVLTLDGDTVALNADWLEALSRERETSGEIALYQRDMRRFNDEGKAYRNRHKSKADRAPSQEEMRETREGYPERRRAAIEAALVRLFAEHPEYRGRRAGQITCRLAFYLAPDFPRGSIGIPRDHEVEAILDGIAA